MEPTIQMFEEMKDKELKVELEKRDLVTKGGRDEYMERLTEAVKRESKKEYDKQQKKKEKEQKKFDAMSKSHIKKALEKNGLDTTGNKEQLIARVKKAKINVKKEMSKIEAAEVEKEEKAKEKARKRLEKAAAKYADMKAPELRTELEKRLSLIHI